MRAFRDVTSTSSFPAPAGSLPRSLLALIVSLITVFGASPLLARQKTHPAGKQKQSASQSPGTIKVLVRDVVVDVVVTGHNGRPVRGLGKQDFKILDDGKPQRIQSFIVHQSVPPRFAAPKLPSLPPGVFTNYSAIPADAPLNIILLDLGNTPLTMLPTVRRHICDFLRKQQIEAPYAVFVMGEGKLMMVQGFTADKDLLIAAINNKQLSSQLYEANVDPFKIRPNLGSTLGAGTNYQYQLDVAARTGRISQEGGQFGTVSADDHLLMAEGLLGMLPPHTGFRAAIRGTRIHTRVGNTVSELADLAALLSALPGRKNLLWFTASLPASVDNLLRVTQENEGGAVLAASDLVYINSSPKIVQAAELLERSRTAVYAIDAHGLETGTSDFRWSKRQSSEHSTLDAMAEITGGHAFYNTNGFKQAMQAAANDGANYYTLTYIPANAQFHGELRHIRVELRNHHQHAHLAYRHSYFANSSDAAPEQAPPPLAFTLQHGAPTAHQVLFWATVSPSGPPHPAKSAGSDPTSARPPSGKPKPKAAHPVMLQTYEVHYLLVPDKLAMAKTANGGGRTKLDFAARAYDKIGQELSTILNTAQVTLTPKAFQRMQEKGLSLDQVVSVPVETAFLRLAVRDDKSNHVGSIEVSLPVTPAPGAQKK